MDAANQALSEALRVTFRLVQAAMIILGVLFLGSGFRNVQEGQRGLKIQLGRVVASNLEPGLHFSWPTPVGEILTVGSGTQEVRLETNKDFFPFVREDSAARWNTAESDLPQSGQLDPAKDGSLVTSDLNLAHAQWTVNYRRDNHEAYATNILPDQETLLVSAAVRRAVVQVVAETGIDDFLKDRDTVAARALEIAQRFLTDLDAGIRIEQLSLKRKFPPVQLLEKFAAVNAAAQTAGQAREKARTEAQSLMNAVAGQAAPVLLARIDAYERALELGQAAEADAILAQIDALLEGRAVEIDGQQHAAGLASGEITEILRAADNTRNALVSDERARTETFLAKRAQFEANPALMLTTEWTGAMTALLSKDFVQTWMLRDDDRDLIELRLNEDPEIRRMLDQALKRNQVERTAADREDRMRAERFRIDQGLKQPEE
jgi:regulator of protease activity HflC (stomatin/prohibitin superfamily)